MTDTDANIAIARWMGWKPDATNPEFHMIGTWSKGGEHVHDFRHLPNFWHDLNAIHLAELHFRKLHPEKIEAWCEVLMDLTPNEPDYVRILGYLSAPAPQRTRALMVMLGLWKD